jgi:hypothetical protein
MLSEEPLQWADSAVKESSSCVKGFIVSDLILSGNSQNGLILDS